MPASDRVLDAVIEFRGGKRNGEYLTDEKINYIAQKTNELYWKNELKKLSVIKRANELVEAQKVRKEALRQIELLRNALLFIPNKLSAKLASETNPIAVHAILSDEIRTVLNTLARNG